MAFWILPMTGDAAKACMSALQAAEQAVKSVAEIRIGQAALHLSVGLHIGPVLSGDFGSTTRNQFTLISPEVNKAARLEQIHREDIVDGDTDIGTIRLSADFNKELSSPVKKPYRRRSVGKAKNIGHIEFYS